MLERRPDSLIHPKGGLYKVLKSTNNSFTSEKEQEHFSVCLDVGQNYGTG